MAAVDGRLASLRCRLPTGDDSRVMKICVECVVSVGGPIG